MYSLLIVFQSVTLEGWSEIQRKMQLCYAYVIFLYFLPLVFIGAFFLLNLTLAVINSKFTEAHNLQQKEEHELMMKVEEGGFDANEDNIKLGEISNKELTLYQYLIAKKCAH